MSMSPLFLWLWDSSEDETETTTSVASKGILYNCSVRVSVCLPECAAGATA